MKNKGLLSINFSIACNDYAKALCKKYDFDYDESYWIADEVGGIFEVNDGEYVFGLLEIIYIVDNDIDFETFDAWYTYTLRLSMISENVPLPNLKSWCKGCPIKSEEDICKLEALKAKLQEAEMLIEENVNKFKNE